MIDIKAEIKNFIKLYGIKGSFKVPNSKYTVIYFSTYANKRQKNSGHSLLLNELKPMRERLNANDIRDISSLLQRDLNDSRVAYELIPYLKGESKNNIAFFPAILAALMPKDFLKDSSIRYPTKNIKEKETIRTIDYDQKWFLDCYLDDKKNDTSLGVLNVDAFETDIVVLDGQHRANAFRVVNNSFNSGANNIYDVFYKDIEIPTSFEADLPVTIIWFESEDSLIDPKIISRKLFVDVNNTARPVSTSRTILLNDKNPSAVLSKYLYSFLAEYSSFDNDKLSLMHSGFDVDSDLKDSNPHIFTLTTPEIIYDINEWLFFGTRINNSLERYFVKKYPKSFSDPSYCARFLPKFRNLIIINSDDENYSKYFDFQLETPEIKNEFNEIVFPIFNNIFGQFIFLEPHYKACLRIQSERDTKWSSSSKKEVWDKVFKGGEGLYYSFKNIPRSKTKSNKPIKEILDTISEIEKEFIKYRSEGFKIAETNLINEAYKSFRTKAFQVGLFMAFFDYLYDDSQDISKTNIQNALEIFIKKLNSISPTGWVFILTELRENIIDGVDPKKWPAYHKIILRILMPSTNNYGNEENISNSPEAWVYYRQLDKKYDGWLKSTDVLSNSVDIKVVEELLISWSEQAINYVKELFLKCEISVLPNINWVNINDEFIINLKSKIVSPNYVDED